jgi:hypothetical protein
MVDMARKKYSSVVSASEGCRATGTIKDAVSNDVSEEIPDQRLSRRTSVCRAACWKSRRAMNSCNARVTAQLAGSVREVKQTPGRSGYPLHRSPLDPGGHSRSILRSPCMGVHHSTTSSVA